MRIDVYDFDGTLFDGESTGAFWRYCLRRRPSLLRFLPEQLLGGLLFLMDAQALTVAKRHFLCFLRGVDAEAMAQDFWSDIYNANTDKFVHSHDWNHEYLHTSGHASRETLAQVCNLVNPHTAIIPIHTEKGSDFTSLDIPEELKNKVVTNDTIVDDIEIKVR